MNDAPRPIFSYPRYWAECLTPAPELPMSRAEMDALGWDSCDIVIVSGDAYVDHPSFGAAVIGRVLEAQGFRVGIIAQPDWRSAEPFAALGRPNLFFGITAGNMDSMVNRYTADRKRRSDDAYTPGGQGGSRPDRASLVYAQRAREAFPDVPIVLGGIEASLRRLAHYDYWSDKVRRSLLVDAKADLLVYGNGERAIVEIAHRLARGASIEDLRDIRGTVHVRKSLPEDRVLVDARTIDAPGHGPADPHPYAMAAAADCRSAPTGEGRGAPVRWHRRGRGRDRPEVVVLPDFEQVRDDKDLYAHASRVIHLETNPGNARPLAQRHGDRWVFVNPPPLPLTTEELDWVFELPYTRRPHSTYGEARIPAYEMIRFSVNIMRGCFGGCTFCSITEHEGRHIQSRSEESILREIETIRDRVPGFTGIISDLGGPTANMYRLACKDPKIEAACRKPSCVYPDICPHLNTDHRPLIRLYRKARSLPGIKKVLVASGLRYDLAVRSPEYVRELVTHHVGGYLKIAPEHTEPGPLSKMLKPGIKTYHRFKRLFDKYSREAGKEQYLIPYFIAAHPGSTDEDMLKLALWLKENGFRPDQVQTFLPSPMATATAMYHSGRNPLRKVTRTSERVFTAKGLRARRLQKAFLRYHDPDNWPLIREALRRMGREDLIGNGKRHLVPAWQPAGSGKTAEKRSIKRNERGGRRPPARRSARRSGRRRP